MHEHFAIKFSHSLIDLVLSDKIRFENLPDTVQSTILAKREVFNPTNAKSLFHNLSDGFKILTLYLPPFERAWLFFSIVIGILLLRGREGAHMAVCLLPILVLCYGVDNYLNGKTTELAPDESLFPTENYLIENYLTDPMPQDIMEQKDALEKAFASYITDEWSGESKNYQEGFFNFTLARVQALQPPALPPPDQFRLKRPLWLLLAFLLWNVFYARYIASRPFEEVR